MQDFAGVVDTEINQWQLFASYFRQLDEEATVRRICQVLPVAAVFFRKAVLAACARLR